MSAGLREFLAMGGYAAFVWPAFGFAAAALIGLLLQSWRAARRRTAELKRLRGAVRPAPAARLLRPSKPSAAAARVALAPEADAGGRSVGIGGDASS